MVNLRVLSFKEIVGGVTSLVIWVKTAVFLKFRFVKNVGSLVTLKLNVKLVQTVKRRKIMDMDEVEAMVEATEETGVAAVQVEVCDLRKMSLTETTLARTMYSLCTKPFTCSTRVLMRNLRTYLISK